MCSPAGGDDFDNVIVDWLAKTYFSTVDWKHPSILSNLKCVAEFAKVSCALTYCSLFCRISPCMAKYLFA